MRDREKTKSSREEPHGKTQEKNFHLSLPNVMASKFKTGHLPLLLLALLVTRFAFAGPVSDEGARLRDALDAMHVEEHWLAGAIVEWRTGEPTGKPITDTGNHTHCSQFAAAFCDRLGVYLLHPPEHSAVLLANAQYDWLPTEAARAKGWSPVKDGPAAQALANRGTLVVAIFKNHDPKKPGHIAIVRPSTKSDAAIQAEGPDVTQAGKTNHTACSLKEGFRNHPGGFEKGEIRFFSHAVAIPAPAPR